jgi:MFS family permease
MKEWLLVVSTAASVFFYAGIVFGWPSLQLWLLEEGQYRELCQKGEKTCVNQISQLDFVYNSGVVATSAASIPIGFAIDHLGQAWVSIASLVFLVAGLLLMGFSDSRRFDGFVAGYCCLGLGGCCTMLASFSVSFQKPDYQAAIVAVLTCAFDASSIIFPIFLTMHSADGWSRRTIFEVYACFCAMLYLTLWALHNTSPNQPATAAELELQGEGRKAVTPGEPPALSSQTFEEQIGSFEFVVIWRAMVSAPTCTYAPRTSFWRITGM